MHRNSASKPPSQNGLISPKKQPFSPTFHQKTALFAPFWGISARFRGENGVIKDAVFEPSTEIIQIFISVKCANV
jgi:hypothetical protein